jgi:hypothetical protein
MQHLPSDAVLDELNRDYAGILASGRIEPTVASKQEIADHDVPDLARLKMRFDRHSYTKLRGVIDRLNHP